jgi:hypothetical protein
MLKWSSLLMLFGLGPTLLAFAPDAAAAGKVVDMGYYDPVTITSACQSAGATPRAGGSSYGCASRDVSIQCNGRTCLAVASDLTPLSGHSLQTVVRAMRQRAGRMVLPLDTRIKPASLRAQ